MVSLIERPPVRGWLHVPPETPRGAVALAHGAGSDARSPILMAAAEALCPAGWAVLRCDLPFRQLRPAGPPRPGDAPQDLAGLAAAARTLRERFSGPCLLGGHSYGGRMASLLAAADPAIADALLLFSYPLHPPGKPERLRTAHFAQLRLPALFLHGSRDPFGALGELESALALIPAPALLLIVEGAGHDLGRGHKLHEAMSSLSAALDQFPCPTSAPSQSPGVE